MKNIHGYKKCKFEDLDSFDRCKPVNCELKYFGKRNFFNNSKCVPATICTNIDDYYDHQTNECRKLNFELTERDRKEIESGSFTNWFDEHDMDEKGDAATITIDTEIETFERVRRSLNSNENFSSSVLSVLAFIVKIIAFVIFIYLMMALLISVLFYLCITCGIVSAQADMNSFERID
jgi:hypothetical protein